MVSTPVPTFTGEVQLRRWSESSTQGVQVTFALADSSDLDPLKAKSGKRFMAVLVEIGDDEQPVPPASQPRQRTEVGPICQWLVMRCNEPEFWNWLSFENPNAQPVKSAVAAGDLVKQILCVESRKEIDGDQRAEREFHKFIRGPYSKWLMRRGVVA